MMEHWGGAQWVLATLLAVSVFLPVSMKCAGFSKRADWGTWYASALVSRLGLIAILWWGGFWS